MDDKTWGMYQSGKNTVEQALKALADGKDKLALNYFITGAEKIKKALDKMKNAERKAEARKILSSVLTHAESLKQKLHGSAPKNVKRKNSNNSDEPAPNGKRAKGELGPLYRLIEDEVVQTGSVKFDDVKGMQGVKQALNESIILPAKRPDIFTGLRAPPNGILLFGPPGNGKTMIAKAIATECGSKFFNISASSLTSKYVGQSEKLIRVLFEMARNDAPSIIFIDEIDSILTARSENEQESSRRMKTEFLVQFDGVGKENVGSDSGKNVLVIGATNLPWELDEAALRRFPKRFEVPLPDPITRQHIIQSNLGKLKSKVSSREIKDIVNKTDGYSGSDLAQLCKDAAMGPVRGIPASKLASIPAKDIPPVSHKHFLQSLKVVRASTGKQSGKKYLDWAKKFGSTLGPAQRPSSDERKVASRRDLAGSAPRRSAPRRTAPKKNGLVASLKL